MKWKDFLISSLKVPLAGIILAGGLALLVGLLPVPSQVQSIAFLVVKILVVMSLFLFLDRVGRFALRLFSDKVQGVDLTRGVIQGLVRFVILALALLILLDMLGISITPLIASLGVGSLAVALGLQETFANFFAGIYIVVDRPVRVGDFIRLESGEEGYVSEVGWRNTRIRMLSNAVVVVPNNKMISSTIRNYFLPDKEIAVLVEVGVHYSSDLAKVERVTVDVARGIQRSVPGAVTGFEPFVRYHTLGDSSINFTVILRAKEFVDQYLLKHEFIKALHRCYQEAGIVIPYPIRTLELAQVEKELLEKKS